MQVNIIVTFESMIETEKLDDALLNDIVNSINIQSNSKNFKIKSSILEDVEILSCRENEDQPFTFDCFSNF